ncbi:MAG: Hsp20/alpha crystallin family protein [bacterium]|nr:Hsp20/alpha crystallin family protein [bacterium]
MYGLTGAFDALWALQKAFDQAARNDYFGVSTTAAGQPPVNLFKDGENTLLTLEIPGVKKEDLSIEVKGNLVRISGQRRLQIPEGASAHRRERSDYRFDRSIRLQHEVDPEQVKAELNDGVLALLLPIKESEKPKSITIN